MEREEAEIMVKVQQLVWTLKMVGRAQTHFVHQTAKIHRECRFHTTNPSNDLEAPAQCLCYKQAGALNMCTCFVSRA